MDIPLRALPQSPLLYDVIGSVVLVAILLITRFFLKRAIIRHVSQREVRLKWLHTARNLLLLILVLGLAAIWAQELRTFALTLAAVGAAFVLATKELIQCVSAYLLRATGRSFSVGDRVEIGPYRGEVVDHNPLTTTILEIGPGRSSHFRTGRTIVLPNNKLFENPVVNESSAESYAVHVFPVPLRAGEDWQRAERVLLEAVQAECGAFLEDAQREMKAMEAMRGFGGSSAEPRISVQLTEPGQISLVARIPAPVGRQARVEEAIVRRFLREYYPSQTNGHA